MFGLYDSLLGTVRLSYYFAVYLLKHHIFHGKVPRGDCENPHLCAASDVLTDAMLLIGVSEAGISLKQMQLYLESESTFNEELYTTKLERGPQMRELEREASRLAREIEGEETHDLHLAEERGIQLDGNLEIDEETRFSSVYRGVDDSGFDEIEDILLDARNDETFGGVSSSVIGKPLMDMHSGKASDGTRVSSRSSSLEEMQSLTAMSRDLYHSGSEDQGQELLAEGLSKDFAAVDATRVQGNQLLGHAESSCAKEDKDKQLRITCFEREGSSESSRIEAADTVEVATSLIPDLILVVDLRQGEFDGSPTLHAYRGY
ncbi:UNVERIFIED_CONTAM: Polyadenylate-binding protein-interacting protein 4 [Sesamum calycinum]|uniref:Polyadenylate-binding protein-interacting protein 4 n=1 Tax=Sesamum calycinum TaxID=2727403 RepID=A0AAW2JM52_9LAMI